MIKQKLYTFFIYRKLIRLFAQEGDKINWAFIDTVLDADFKSKFLFVFTARYKSL